MTTGTIVKGPEARAESRGFTRDKLTWLGYLLYGYWSYVWGLFGPVMPFMRDELKLNYGIAALHFSALALGPLMAGYIGYHVIRWCGPTRAIWYGTGLIVAGVLCVLFGTSHYLTIFGAWLVGFGGSHAGQAIIAGLADRFEKHRSIAIAEINVVGSVFTLVAPLTVAAAIMMGLPWRATFLFSVLMVGVMCLVTKCGGGQHFRINELARSVTASLPGTFWLYFAIVFLSVAAEWSICFWCPEFLIKVHHFSHAHACNGLSAFLIAMLVGRAAGCKLTSMIPTRIFLPLTAVAAACGFFFFWLGQNPIVCTAGLIVLGLGESNVYPLSLAASIGASRGLTAKATSMMAVCAGAAILLAPLVLGMFADRIGILSAYGIVATLLVVAAVTAVVVTRSVGKLEELPF